MKAFVTGASGFVGSHVARELREAGAEVRDAWVDVLDRPGLERAFAGCDAVFHVAALYSYEESARRHELVNVEGTRNVLTACERARVRRLVHTSTAATCGPVRGRAATEEDGPPPWELAVPYKRTKLAAERLVLAAAVAPGIDAVVVNPTTPVGEGDWRPTPTGRMVEAVATGRFRAFLGGAGLNLVDVRDVARGHVLAFERGRRGERYLLGGVDLTLEDVFGRIAELAGRPRPRLRLPYAAARAAALLGTANRQEVTLARLPHWFSSEKAHRELGYEPGPIHPALARAVAEALQRVTKRQAPAMAKQAVSGV